MLVCDSCSSEDGNGGLSRLNGKCFVNFAIPLASVQWFYVEISVAIQPVLLSFCHILCHVVTSYVVIPGPFLYYYLPYYATFYFPIFSLWIFCFHSCASFLFYLHICLSLFSHFPFANHVRLCWGPFMYEVTHCIYIYIFSLYIQLCSVYYFAHCNLNFLLKYPSYIRLPVTAIAHLSDNLHITYCTK